MIGEKFGRLKVLEVGWKCKCLCECGTEVTVTKSRLLSSHTKSCGCLRRDQAAEVGRITTHGLAYDPLYKVWCRIVSRCSKNTSVKDRKNYQERGIGMCSDWRSNPAAFISWAKDNGYKKGLQIDRVNNDLGYSPDNCRWTTPLENQHNKRVLSSKNTSGYAGVSLDGSICKFRATVFSKAMGGRISLGYFDTSWEACQIRNKFIIENNLPHKIQEERV